MNERMNKSIIQQNKFIDQKQFAFHTKRKKKQPTMEQRGGEFHSFVRWVEKQSVLR